MTEALQMIALTAIARSPTNPRKTFDQAELEKLAASIREFGVCQNIIVRPHPKPKGEVKYELVAGERRWRASKLADKSDIPAVVRDLTDKQVRKIQVIENDQREDVKPLEQADGYQGLLNDGDDVATIAASIGRSEAYVYARLELLKLIPALKKDLAVGKLPFGHATLLARVDPAVQRDMLKNGGVYDWHGRVETIKHLRDRIKHDSFRCLSAAKWKKDDATLLPEAGACKTCPKRTAARPDLFEELLNGDGQGRDFCIDPACYAKKSEAYIELQIRTTKEETGKQPLRISDDYYTREKGVLPRSDYEIVSKKDAGKVAAGKLKTAVFVKGDKAGQVVQVKMREQGASASTIYSERHRREAAAQRRKQVAGKLAAAAANGSVVVAVEAAFKRPSAKATKLLRTVICSLVGRGMSDACNAVMKRRNLEGKRHQATDLVTKEAQRLDDVAGLMGLLAEVAAATESQNWGHPYFGSSSPREAAFWSAFGIDRGKLMKQAHAEIKEKKKAKKLKTVKA